MRQGDWRWEIRRIASSAAKKFRRLVAGVVRIDGGRTKHDHHGTGYKDWLARTSAVKLSRLTPDAVQRWKTRHITAAGTNPLKERRARRTFASVLRCSNREAVLRLLRECVETRARMNSTPPADDESRHGARRDLARARWLRPRDIVELYRVSQSTVCVWAN